MVIKEFLKETTINKDKLPKHIALSIEGCSEFSKKKGISYEETEKKKFFNIKNIIRTCVKLGIPIASFYLFPLNPKEDSYNTNTIDNLASFFNDLKEWDFLNQNKIKISVLGKWYDLPGRLVDPIKEVLQHTKDYDSFFVNLCINYDGQQEIVDAAKLIARQVKAGRIDPDSIEKSDIKENIYSSYFLPPDLIIKTGRSRKMKGFLLWDSIDAKIYFSGIPWPEFDRLYFLKSLEFFQK